MNGSQKINGVGIGLNFIDQAVVIAIAYYLAVRDPRQDKDQEETQEYSDPLRSVWLMAVGHKGSSWLGQLFNL